jgi:hypothetical protein
MKPVEIILSGGVGKRMMEMMERGNPTKVYCKHMGEYHNVSFCTTKC